MVIVNRDETPLDGLAAVVIHGAVEEVVPALGVTPARPANRRGAGGRGVRIVTGTLAIGLALRRPATAPADWPQWRGPAPRRPGGAAGASRRWPKALTPGWKATVGLGHASPVVAGDRVFVFAREGQDEVASAYDLATGRRLWRQAYAGALHDEPRRDRRTAPGPSRRRWCGGGRLYTFGISGTLSCFDAAYGHARLAAHVRGAARGLARLRLRAVSPAGPGPARRPRRRRRGRRAAEPGRGHGRDALVARGTTGPATRRRSWPSWTACGSRGRRRSRT